MHGPEAGQGMLELKEIQRQPPKNVKTDPKSIVRIHLCQKYLPPFCARLYYTRRTVFVFANKTDFPEDITLNITSKVTGIW